jgi:hypothetical protein
MDDWEYLFVVAISHNGVLHPSTINGQEVDCGDQILLADYIAQVEQQGWDLSAVATSDSSADTSLRLIFRRQRA